MLLKYKRVLSFSLMPTDARSSSFILSKFLPGYDPKLSVLFGGGEIFFGGED